MHAETGPADAIHDQYICGLFVEPCEGNAALSLLFVLTGVGRYLI